MIDSWHSAERVAILGAGISGLSLGWLLSKLGKRATLFEASDTVGGLSRTFNWHGVPCDLAPHRLYSRNPEVIGLIEELVPLREHRRNSRILMKGVVIQDPINPIELLMRFPAKTGAALVWGFLNRPRLPEDSFENLALNRYGRGLYDFFFAPYTKKMFGVPPAEISVTWGREKLRSSGLLDAIRRSSKTFFSTFHYPAHGGYGQIAEGMCRAMDQDLRLRTRVTGLETRGDRITGVRYRDAEGEHAYPCDRVFATIPATGLGKMLGRSFELRYRSIDLVFLHVRRPRVMPHHWVYFGDGDVVINRMAEFRNFHPDATPSRSTVLCAEVTVETDSPVEDVLAALTRYGLLDRSDVDDALVVNERYGYPIYDRGFEQQAAAADAFFSGFANLHRVGRNAEFRHIELDEDLESALRVTRSVYGHAEFLRPSPAADHELAPALLGADEAVEPGTP